MKKLLSIVSVCVFASIAPTGSAVADTLGQALAAAYSHSGLLLQNRALLRAADEDVAAATAALRPVINYTLSSNYSSITEDVSTNFGLSASLLIFDSGSSELRRQVARENVMSTREALRGVEQNVLLQAVSAYLAVQRDNQLLSPFTS